MQRLEIGIALIISLFYSIVVFADSDEYLDLLRENNPTLFREKRTKEESKCVDFSGLWEGTCKVTFENGQTATQQMQRELVQEDCHTITFNGEKQVMGMRYEKREQFVANGRYGLAKPHSSVSIGSMLDWNEDKTELRVSASYVFFPMAGNTLINVKKAIGRYKIENGRMLHVMKLFDVFTFDCELQKQS